MSANANQSPDKHHQRNYQNHRRKSDVEHAPASHESDRLERGEIALPWDGIQEARSTTFRTTGSFGSGRPTERALGDDQEFTKNEGQPLFGQWLASGIESLLARRTRARRDCRGPGAYGQPLRPAVVQR